jgi:cytochrome P450
MSAAPASSAPRPAHEIPRAGVLVMLRQLVGGRRERVDMLSGLRDLHTRYGEVVQQVAGPLRFVNLFGPEANRHVLLDRDRMFSAERPWTAIMGRIFPGGLLLKDGAEHRHHRKIMHTAFRRSALREYGDRMNPMIEQRLDDWAARRDLLAFPAFKELTLDMAASIFLGEDLGPGTRTMNQAFEDLVAASMSRVRLPLPGLEFHRGLKAREFMKGFLGDRIDKKRSGDGPDMFTRLCHAETEEGHRFSDREIVDHMIFLMMAAHDTTTSTLCSMVYELARHPEWQDRVRAECEAFGKETVGFEDIDGFRELTWVMKETLRRYPPLPVIPRVAQEDFVFGGYEIPKNAMVVVAPIHTHHMPEWWSDPFRFDPERFAPERAEDAAHSHVWAPFGGGPHHCLGFRFAEVQIKAILHQMLRRFRWSVEPGYTMPVQQAPISKPMDGLPIRLDPLLA